MQHDYDYLGPRKTVQEAFEEELKKKRIISGNIT
jgi:hypothetical protein